MVRLGVFLVYIILQSSVVSAQDTSCGIVWYPPIQISPGIAGVDESVPSIAVQGDTVHITWAFTSQKAPYRRSVDGGRTFEPVRELAPDTTQLTAWCAVLASQTHATGFWIEYPQRRTWSVRSTDRGTSWGRPRIVADSIGRFSFAATSGDSIVLGMARDPDYRRIYHSTDTGNTWTATLPEIIGNDPRIAMTPGAVHMVRTWAFDSAGVWSEFVAQYSKSTDLGETWSDPVNLSTMSSRAYEPAIAADGQLGSGSVVGAWKDAKYGCLTLGFCSIMSRHLMLPDSLWSPEHLLTPEPRGAFARTAIAGAVTAVAWTAELPPVFHNMTRISTTGGVTWCPPLDLTPDSAYTGGSAIAVGPTTIHVAYGQLIGGQTGRWRVFYRRGVLLPTSVKEEPRIPPAFASLSQNYPNPFNPSTTIVYRVESRVLIELRVYDLLGREVAILVNEKKEPGEHSVEWKSEGVPSGVYFYRLIGERKSLTRRMILVK